MNKFFNSNDGGSYTFLFLLMAMMAGHDGQDGHAWPAAARRGQQQPHHVVVMGHGHGDGDSDRMHHMHCTEDCTRPALPTQPQCNSNSNTSPVTFH